MSRTRLSGLLAIPLLSASLLAGATPALALGTLDPEAPADGGSIQVSGSDIYMGQSFTAGLSGELDAVSLVPNESLNGAVVEIRAATSGLPTGPALASSTITSSVTRDWVAITFPTPAIVVAGSQYVIIVGPRASLAFVTGSTYAGGFGSVNHFDHSKMDEQPLDLAFRTFVTAPTYGFAWRSPTKGKGQGVNKPQAGTTVAVTFSLDSARNKSTVIEPGWPKARRVNCSTKKPIPGTQWQTRPFGAKGLTRSGNDYTYGWHVRAEWGNGPLACREFRIKLTDGTTHSALYRFQPAP